jgi:hypothetical protein
MNICINLVLILILLKVSILTSKNLIEHTAIYFAILYFFVKLINNNTGICI